MCVCARAYSGVQLWFIGLSTDTTRTTKSIHKLNTAEYHKMVRKKKSRGKSHQKKIVNGHVSKS